MHAGCLVDEVHAGVTDKCVVDALFGSGLRIGELRVADARRRSTGQVVEVRHLRACCRQEHLLGATTRHCTGAQVG
ncbi:MAG: hypothetical protein RLZZ449_209, partial [Actinomycetota bacterium]